MRGDLQNRIRRGVADRRARPHMLGAEALDDLGSRGNAIAQNAGKFSFRDQGGGEFRRQAGHGFRKIAPGFERGRPGDFPMARRRILARRALDAIAPQRAGFRWTREAGRQASRRSLGGEAKAQAAEMGEAQRAAPQAFAVPRARGAGRREMAERIGARVAEAGRVPGAAAAKRVKNEEDRAGHGRWFRPTGSRPHWSRP